MSEEMEKIDGEVVETESTDKLQEEIKYLRDTIKDYSSEIDHIRADNSVLKEAIVRLQLKSLGLME